MSVCEDRTAQGEGACSQHNNPYPNKKKYIKTHTHTHHIISPQQHACQNFHGATLVGTEGPTPHYNSVVSEVGSLVPLQGRLGEGGGNRDRGLGFRGNPSVLRREATFGYGNGGGRPPRGNLGCGIRGSSLQRARRLSSPI